MQLIDGKAIGKKLNEETKRKTENLKRTGVVPGLAVVLVGTDPASVSYVRSKDRISQDLGFLSRKIELPEQTSEAELLQIVKELNADQHIHAILVQSPLPKQIDETKITLALDPAKDVDGFHPINVGKLTMGDPSGFVPCTPLGVQRLLLELNAPIAGAHVVVLGRSMIVGKPVALLLMRKGHGGDATVTVV